MYLGETVKHIRNSFEFVIDAPIEKAFPLFGADRERVWAPGWEPQFVYPEPAKDVAGAVFRVQHNHQEAVWVNTAFDAAAGHVQYANFLPGMMVTLIDIRLTSLADARTQANVVYERTSLSDEGNALVIERNGSDGKMGAEWATEINSYLQIGR
jgi:hypothetical protein